MSPSRIQTTDATEPNAPDSNEKSKEKASEKTSEKARSMNASEKGSEEAKADSIHAI